MAKIIYIDDNGNQEVLKEGNIYKYDVFFRDDYFGMKLFGREDIAMRIEDNYDREATEDEIDEVIKHGGKWWGLNDCTDGEWNCIDDEIFAVLGKPEEYYEEYYEEDEDEEYYEEDEDEEY